MTTTTNRWTISKEFVLGGKAIFTVVSGRTGVRYTFKVKFKKASPGSCFGDAWFVSVLTGPDNNSSYTYMGMMDPLLGTFRLTKASTYNSESAPVKAFRWALSVLWGRVQLQEGCEIHHEGRCCRCGRRLTVPESIKSGIGPECAKRN